MNGILVMALLSFCIGSVPFGLILVRLFSGGDVRKMGSRNIGAANVTRVAGLWPAGLLTFACDALKGTLAVMLAGRFAGPLLEGWTFFPVELWQPGGELLQWFCAVFVVLGHCFSPWLKFRGGKGVATSFGAIAVLSPWASLVGIAAFAIVFLQSRVASLSSLAGLLVVMVAHAVLPGFYVGPHLLCGGVLVFIILARHEKNLDALLESREYRF